MLKRILVLAVLFALSLTPSVRAQITYKDSSLKDALVEYLYQYGKETFYRGVNPQEASFILQRALVLDCAHPGAQAFLNKIKEKHPEVSVRVQGCAEREPVVAEVAENPLRTARTAVTDRLPDEEAKARALKREVANAEDQMNSLSQDLKEKDKVIDDYQSQLRSERQVEEEAAPQQEASAGDDVRYSKIANDQKDLIRIQQNNIDYLKNELAEAKKQVRTGVVAEDEYAKSRLEIADSGLDAYEQKTAVAVKDEETRDLRQRLNDLQEQLALVQKIVDEKNRTIEELQRELKPSSGQL